MSADDRRTASPRYLLRLFVTGSTARSALALRNLKAICESHLHGLYRLEVIDIYQQPELAEREQLVALPTVIRTLPEPVRKVIGDLSDTERVVVGLDIKPQDEASRSDP